AIGASRLHLTRQLTVEALLLAVIGSVIGWVVGAQAIRVALPLAPASIPRLCEVSLDGTVALFVIAVTGVVAALLAVAPLAALAGTGTMRQFLEDSLGPRRFNLGLFGAFASTAVLLALVGLYGHSGGGHSGAPHWSRADGRLAARAPRGPDRTDAGAQGTVTP